MIFHALDNLQENKKAQKMSIYSSRLDFRNVRVRSIRSVARRNDA